MSGWIELRAGTWAVVGAAMLGGCGANNESGLFTGGGVAASGGIGAAGGDGGVFLDGAAASGGSGGIIECAGQTSTAEQVPLDMYIMFDRSGSMALTTSGGVVKWDAAKQALTTFVNDPLSVGLGVGLQYFPVSKPGVPPTCTTHAQCGAGAPCLLSTCMLPGDRIVACEDSADCPGFGNRCVELGICSQTPDVVCAPVGRLCGGIGAGMCTQMVESYCVNGTDCTAAVYGTPAVPIAPLPGAASGVVASLDAQVPDGNTPTAPALQGAIDHARGWVGANPLHRVVVVMATDGLPTECSPLDIPSIVQIAQAGQAGSPPISTFVIGVFAPEETDAAGNLHAIASAGGSGAAFLVDTSQNVTQQFLEALNQIRGTALTCEYLIPDPPVGETLDFWKVNVEFTEGGQTTPILYVVSESQCDPSSGGWYYDVDPQSGGTPTRIRVCPATCDVFTGSTGGQVDIRMGCETVVAAPR